MATTNQGHAFISYVREDAERVDRLEAILKAAGIPVWRDTADLWPGEDWRARIRHAITKNALAFIACFSKNSEGRPVSGQNEELTLAIEQLRLRRPDQPWLIPVRFDDVAIPDIEIGGGRTLNSIQRADLIDDTWEQGAARLVAGVMRALDRPVEPTTLPEPPVSMQTQLKTALRDPAGDIALNDVLVPLANEIRNAMSDETTFPSSSDALSAAATDAAFYVVDLVDAYVETLNVALDALVVVAQWAREDQAPTMSRFIERLAPSNAGGTGMVVLSSLRWFPLLPVVYTSALAALHQENFAALRATTLDAKVRDILDGRVPVIARAHPWRPFRDFELVPQLLALRASGEELTREVAEALRTGRRGKRYTPLSDYLHDILHLKFASEVPDDDDYSDLFDRAEIFLALIAIDAKAHKTAERAYFDGPHFGRFTWRDPYSRPEERLEAGLLRQLQEQGDAWPPLRGGLFGRSVERAAAALEVLIREADEARSRRF